MRTTWAELAMNRASSTWTGRAPRTLQQAFGPYTSRGVLPMQEREQRRWDRVMLWILAAFVVLCLMGVV